MKFAISLSMERFSPTDSMSEATMSNMLTLARIADEGGFETLWTAEHHTIECTVSPNPFAILTWLSQHTQRIRLGTATLVAPVLVADPARRRSGHVRPPDRGRLEFGIARGAYPVRVRSDGRRHSSAGGRRVYERARAGRAEALGRRLRA